MLHLDDDRFLAIQTAATASVNHIRDAVSRAIQGGASNVFFLGAGGAGILMQPAHDLLRRSSSFSSYRAQLRAHA